MIICDCCNVTSVFTQTHTHKRVIFRPLSVSNSHSLNRMGRHLWLARRFHFFATCKLSKFLPWVRLSAVLCQFVRGIPVALSVRYSCKEVLANHLPAASCLVT